ncbi:MAG: hypothetical protein IPN77_31740 [Sandaracinaceae bacterium]|nr:hypothetical protein [Sandaracinaceae bacterium]
MNHDAILRLRYAPEAALVAASIEVVALLRMSLLAAHQRLLDERPAPSRERRLALRLIHDIDTLLRDAARYYDYVSDLAAPKPEPVEPTDGL